MSRVFLLSRRMASAEISSETKMVLGSISFTNLRKGLSVYPAMGARTRIGLLVSCQKFFIF